MQPAGCQIQIHLLLLLDRRSSPLRSAFASSSQSIQASLSFVYCPARGHACRDCARQAARFLVLKFLRCHVLMSRVLFPGRAGAGTSPSSGWSLPDRDTGSIRKQKLCRRCGPARGDRFPSLQRDPRSPGRSGWLRSSHPAARDPAPCRRSLRAIRPGAYPW